MYYTFNNMNSKIRKKNYSIIWYGSHEWELTKIIKVMQLIENRYQWCKELLHISTITTIRR